ncbi:unnamed protein product [Phytomonas sp. Hart1]|nr:unnamed protein product [Phytomonas sp. Hart1]|eukprot:CCW67603.1 unnamed protein product [Phytomonas sp. isolate Hart1]
MGHESVTRCSPQCEVSNNITERLSCIASYFSGSTSPYLPSDQQNENASISSVPQSRRLPLAWLAASPLTRLIAEQMEAERLVFFRFLHGSTSIDAGKSGEVGVDGNEEEDPLPLMFAVSTTSLSTIQEAIFDENNNFKSEEKKHDLPRIVPFFDQINSSKLGQVHLSDAYNSVDDRNLYEKRSSWGKTRCGTQVAGLITVLISARDLLKKSLENHKTHLSVNDATCLQQMSSQPPPSLMKGGFNDTWISHEIPGIPLREWICSNSDSVPDKIKEGKNTNEQSLKGISTKRQRHTDVMVKKGCNPVDLLSSLPHEEKYLFPITALPAEVMSIPEMVNFSYSIPSGSDLKKNGQNTVVQFTPADDRRETLKSAASTLNASRLAHWAAHLSLGHDLKSTSIHKCDDVSGNYDLMYRVVLVTRPDAVENVMLGVSQWWLQRPIYLHELGYNYNSKGTPHEYPSVHNNNSIREKNGVLVPIQLKFASLDAASVFYVPLKVSLLCRFMVFVCYVHACLAFCFTLCDSVTTATWLPSEQISEWCGLTAIPIDQSNGEAYHNEFSSAANGKAVPMNLLTSLLFALSILVAIPLLMLIIFLTLLLRFLNHFAGHLYPGQQSTLMRMLTWIKHMILFFNSFEKTVCAHWRLQNRLRERASAMKICHWLYRLGYVYANQMETLDISHTGICGTHLLAFALGIHTATNGDGSATPHCTSALRALDASGCLFLDQPCDEHLLQTELDMRRYLGISSSSTKKDMGSDAATADEMLAYSENLRMLSHAGRALARLSLGHQPMDTGRKHGLQLINASGSSLNTEVLDELGQCVLLYELETVHRHFVSTKMNVAVSGVGTGGASSLTSLAPSPSSSLIAINLTSCRKVCSVNALSYITSLVQIIAPFTEINNAGVVHLDGSAFHQVLQYVADSVCHLTHLRCTRSGTNLEDSKTGVEHGVYDGIATPLFCTTTSFVSLLNYFVDNYADKKQEFVSRFTEMKFFLEHRFQTHLYHLDLTFCLKVENLASLCERQYLLHYLNVSHTNVRTTGLAEIVRKQAPGHHASARRPLRVLVAEYCNVLNDLNGIQMFPLLTKLYVRNGSLDASGLGVFSSHAVCFNNLIFLDLSYCEKVENVSMLASLPSLQTLILDNTEILCNGIKGLGKCPTLQTLSLRFCPDFAPVGPSKERLEQMVVRIPTLQTYIYENLACDEVPREDA